MPLLGRDATVWFKHCLCQSPRFVAGFHMNFMAWSFSPVEGVRTQACHLWSRHQGSNTSWITTFHQRHSGQTFSAGLRPGNVRHFLIPVYRLSISCSALWFTQESHSGSRQPRGITALTMVSLRTRTSQPSRCRLCSPGRETGPHCPKIPWRPSFLALTGDCVSVIWNYFF